MTQLADAVDAINRYTGTDAETERILDLALPTMQYHANRFHYYHSRFDVDDLIANMQLYLFQWLKGKQHNGINQVRLGITKRKSKCRLLLIIKLGRNYQPLSENMANLIPRL